MSEKGIKVLILSHPLSLFHYLYHRNLKRLKLYFNLDRKGENLYSYTPFSIFPLTDRLNMGTLGIYFSIWSIVPSLKSMLTKWGFNKVDVLWITNHNLYYVSKFISYSAIVSRITDDPDAWLRTNRTIKKFLDMSINHSDLVLTTAFSLKSRYMNMNSNTFCIPNGVDFQHFSTVNSEIPKEKYQYSDKPWVIYIGAIHSWFDVELLVRVAQQLPYLNFILIGPVSINIDIFKTLSNIKILGPRPYSDLPSYLKFARVGIIPFRDTKLVKSVSPIKMIEYLAAGLPVVSTPMPEALQLAPPIKFAHNSMEFADAIRSYLICPPPKEELQIYACRHSWENRYNEIYKLIENILN